MFEDNTKSKQAVQRIGQIKIHENEAKLAPEAFYAHVHEESFNINYVHKRKTILGHILCFLKKAHANTLCLPMIMNSNMLATIKESSENEEKNMKHHAKGLSNLTEEASYLMK